MKRFRGLTRQTGECHGHLHYLEKPFNETEDGELKDKIVVYDTPNFIDVPGKKIEDYGVRGLIKLNTTEATGESYFPSEIPWLVEVENPSDMLKFMAKNGKFAAMEAEETTKKIGIVGRGYGHIIVAEK